MRKAALGLILVVLIIVFAWKYPFVDRAGQQATFRVAQVEKGPIISAVSSSGTLNAVITVQVGSQVSGQIKQLFADFNSEVRKDQIIAQIDSENFKARVLQAEGELEVARANVAIQRAAVKRSRAELKNAQASYAAAKAQTDKATIAVKDTKRDLDRKQRLHKQNIIPDSDLDKATAAHDQALAQLSAAKADERAQASMVNSREAMLSMAEAQVEHALAQVKQRGAVVHQASIDLEHTIIRSPVDGVVIERNVDIGQTVAASLQAPTLFTIAQDLRKMQVETDLDEADIGRIEVGQRASFTVDAFPGHEFEGMVEQVRKAPKTLQNVVTYTVVVSAENPHLRLLPGMTANVKVVVDERAEALKVPNAALRFRPSDDKNAQTAPSGGGKIVGGDPTDRMNRLIKALNLDQGQQAELRTIFAEMREKIVGMRREGVSPDEIRAEAERMRSRARETVLAMLTPEQRDKFLRLDAARASGPLTTGRVWVLGPEGKPAPLEVLTGISDGSFTEIVRGNLRPGQQLIVGSTQPSRGPSGGTKRFGF